MAECSRCGGHVTSAFVRVFARADGEVPGCPACTTYADLTDGPTAERADRPSP